ncbi:MAG TPA: hypothetical protein VHI71_02045 [Actinomycetota bacterium]|nr:hypothetical protein [Actinomycetota bacterium]
MIEVPRGWDDAAPRPDFADELLARLALGEAPPREPGQARSLLAGALGGATVALLLTRRRRER